MSLIAAGIASAGAFSHTSRKPIRFAGNAPPRASPGSPEWSGGGSRETPPPLPQYQLPAPRPTPRLRHAWESAAGWGFRLGWGTRTSPPLHPISRAPSHLQDTGGTNVLHGQVAHLFCAVFINTLIISNEKLKEVGGSGGGGGTHSPSASRGPYV